jgi:hypothetical protein
LKQCSPWLSNRRSSRVQRFARACLQARSCKTQPSYVIVEQRVVKGLRDSTIPIEVLGLLAVMEIDTNLCKIWATSGDRSCETGWSMKRWGEWTAYRHLTQIEILEFIPPSATNQAFKYLPILWKGPRYWKVAEANKLWQSCKKFFAQIKALSPCVVKVLNGRHSSTL